MRLTEKQLNDRLYYQENKEVIKQRTSEYYKANREIALLKMRERYLKIREKKLQYAREYRKNNREKIALSLKKWGQENREYIAVTSREKYKTNLQHRLRIALRTRQTKALQGNYKIGSFIRDLGCTISEFKFYLEGKFTDGMSWENYGKKGWHIDHEIPLAFFDLNDREQFLKACHYTNLQPMWAVENLRKGSKINH